MHKLTKLIEKKFKTDLDSLWDPKAFLGKEATLNRAIAMHFIREGRFGIAHHFIAESELPNPPTLQSDFSDMYTILESISAGSLDLAIQWAFMKHAELTKRGSTLLFRLYRVRFIMYLHEKNVDGALNFAKSHFGSFATTQFKGNLKFALIYLFISTNTIYHQKKLNVLWGLYCLFLDCTYRRTQIYSRKHFGRIFNTNSPVISAKS